MPQERFEPVIARSIGMIDVGFSVEYLTLQYNCNLL